MEPSIERLNSTNYNTWKEDVRVLLMVRNNWRIITGQEVKPDNGASAKEKLHNFESRRDWAYSTIYLSIEKEYRNLILDTCDPIVAWKKLQDHFQPHTRARVIGLLDEFFNCRILEEEEIGLYAACLRTIVFQLRDVGHPLEGLYQAFQLFRSSQNESIRGIPKLKSINVECEDCKIDSQGIEMERTSTYSPEMNGVSERFNYTPLDAIRAMLRSSGLSNKFWSEALLCFTYTWNRICHKNQTKTPFELYCGKKPLVKHLKTFGYKAYVGVPKQLRDKLFF
ncbi:retrovirus-related Pol polyprotein from transposon TNT 1-94 [Trichonephila clavipes]|nr:retrovirus-related Pol polyprotein from transposon TNT 1-94 [Trichonephila clavipes]